MTPMNDLASAVEKVRAEKFPHLPASLVSEILAIEADSVVNRAPAMKRIQAVIDKYVSAHEGK